MSGSHVRAGACFSRTSADKWPKIRARERTLVRIHHMPHRVAPDVDTQHASPVRPEVSPAPFDASAPTTSRKQLVIPSPRGPGRSSRAGSLGAHPSSIHAQLPQTKHAPAALGSRLKGYLTHLAIASALEATLYEAQKLDRAEIPAALPVLRRWEDSARLRKSEWGDTPPISSAQACEAVRRLLDRSPQLSPAQAEALYAPLAQAARYLGARDTPRWEQRSASELARGERAADATTVQGFPSEVAAIETRSLTWPDVDAYVASRLGPLAACIDELSARDRLVFSNAGIGDALPALPPVTEAVRLHLPVSSWNKHLHLLAHEDGTRTLVVSDFPGSVLLRHFALLAKHRLDARAQAPAVLTIESASRYRASYQGLQRFFAEHAQALGRVDAVAIGYASGFAEHWGEPAASVSDASGWSARVYALNGGKRSAVLETSESLHGELLGENLAALLDDHPEIAHVLVAGSAGSLHARAPYSFVFPSQVVAPDGGAHRNALSSGSDGLRHQSVISPLEETPDFLSCAQRAQTTTLDMEMGYVAAALRGRPVTVGYGLLVTDFPTGFSLAKNASLTFQDAGQKRAAISDFVASVEALLSSGTPRACHPIEATTGKRIAELSAENMTRRMAELGALSPDEQALYDRVQALAPSYSFRMTPARLARLAEDGAILSTHQVATLKGSPVSPYTPKLEDDLYGAFDYTFGAIGFSDGDPRYGEVLLRLRPEVWQARSWASKRSGWEAERRLTLWKQATPSEDELREHFSTWIVAPEHYRPWIATQAVWAFREGDDALKDAFRAAPDDASLAALMNAQNLGYLEGKIRGSLNLCDIESVSVPQGTPEDVIGRLRAQGVSVTVG